MCQILALREVLYTVDDLMSHRALSRSLRGRTSHGVNAGFSDPVARRGSGRCHMSGVSLLGPFRSLPGRRAGASYGSIRWVGLPAGGRLISR